MPQLHSSTNQSPGELNGAPASELEAKLRFFFGEQRRLRELLEQTRAELDRVNRDLLQYQDEYCTDSGREAEYLDCLESILGYSIRVDPKEIEEAQKNPVDFKAFLAELEKIGQHSVRAANG